MHFTSLILLFAVITICLAGLAGVIAVIQRLTDPHNDHASAIARARAASVVRERREQI